MSGEFESLRRWIGRTESCHDVASAWPVAALAATLDRKDPEPAAGDAIPPGWHWLYFLETTPASELGADGHAARGGFLPPVTLPRRMWAGGRIEFLRALRVGEVLRRDSEIIAVEPKHGKSGNLVFVTVRHTVLASGATATIEEHDIVYRDAARPGEPSPHGTPAPAQAEWRRELEAGPVMLFRFSALIFNAHRIHYDLDYARDEERYPGLVVHGPLQAVLLLDLARREDPRPVKKLVYRAVRPIFHTERFTVNGKRDGSDKAELWIASAAGYLAMTATAHF